MTHGLERWSGWSGWSGWSVPCRSPCRSPTRFLQGVRGVEGLPPQPRGPIATAAAAAAAAPAAAAAAPEASPAARISFDATLLFVPAARLFAAAGLKIRRNRRAGEPVQSLLGLARGEGLGDSNGVGGAAPAAPSCTASANLRLPLLRLLEVRVGWDPVVNSSRAVFFQWSKSCPLMAWLVDAASLFTFKHSRTMPHTCTIFSRGHRRVNTCKQPHR